MNVSVHIGKQGGIMLIKIFYTDYQNSDLALIVSVVLGFTPYICISILIYGLINLSLYLILISIAALLVNALFIFIWELIGKWLDDRAYKRRSKHRISMLHKLLSKKVKTPKDSKPYKSIYSDITQDLKKDGYYK